MPDTCPFSQPDPVHASHFIHPKIILPSIPESSKWSLSPRFLHYSHTCHNRAHLFLLDLINRIIFGKEYISLSSSLRNYLHSLLTSSPLGQIFSSAPNSQTPSAYIHPSIGATKFHTHKKQKEKLYNSVYLNIFRHQNGRYKILHRMTASIP